jgi:arsenate reductase
VCAGNSTHSILGEVILNIPGAGGDAALSARSQPKGAVHPGALHLLARRGIDSAGLHSRIWDVFTSPDAPPIDFVITLCVSAAGETCRVFPGNPLRAHWGLPDPAAVNGDGAAVDTAFAQTRAWLDLPFEMMERAALLARLAAIGQIEGAR